MIKLFLLLLPLGLFADCVEEKTLSGLAIKNLATHKDIYIKNQNGIFKKADNNLSNFKLYDVQISKHNKILKSNDRHNDYNREYVEYYTYARMQKYIEDNKSLIENAGYKVEVVGRSIEGRNLYSITPKVITNKKAILMLGRHHGDEGTANWLIEGFFSKFLNEASFRSEFQLFLYPMINPDGAENHSRYNSNGRDLNRAWHKDINQNYDESKIIHTDIKKYLPQIEDKLVIVLDMHGSFTEDFIYRVKKNFAGRAFYNLQQNYIDTLARFDSWQNGNFKRSNGDPAMARIVMVKHYKKNALTHETIRNVRLNNSEGRTKKSLLDQGIAVFDSVDALY